jgi:uncharacterized oligopeptide transporter (OPT) family protein
MALARLPLRVFKLCRSIHVQNLVQSAISASTFGAANSLLLPVGIPFLLGRPDLVPPMLAGAFAAMLLDGYLLYRMFGTRVFPATGAWPPGVAAAEAIKAGDQGGRKAALMGLDFAASVLVSFVKAPLAWIGFPGSTAARRHDRPVPARRTVSCTSQQRLQQSRAGSLIQRRTFFLRSGSSW